MSGSIKPPGDAPPEDEDEGEKFLREMEEHGATILSMTEAYFEKIQEDIFEQGRDNGYQEGYKDGVAQGSDDSTKAFIYYMYSFLTGHYGKEIFDNVILTDGSRKYLDRVIEALEVQRDGTT